jgi:hypothetical protein
MASLITSSTSVSSCSAALRSFCRKVSTFGRISLGIARIRVRARAFSSATTAATSSIGTRRPASLETMISARSAWAISLRRDASSTVSGRSAGRRRDPRRWRRRSLRLTLFRANHSMQSLVSKTHSTPFEPCTTDGMPWSHQAVTVGCVMPRMSAKLAPVYAHFRHPGQVAPGRRIVADCSPSRVRSLTRVRSAVTCSCSLECAPLQSSRGGRSARSGRPGPRMRQ